MYIRVGPTSIWSNGQTPLAAQAMCVLAGMLATYHGDSAQLNAMQQPAPLLVMCVVLCWDVWSLLSGI